MLQAAPRAARKLFLLLLSFTFIFYIFIFLSMFGAFSLRNALFALESSFFASKHALVKLTMRNCRNDAVGAEGLDLAVLLSQGPWTFDVRLVAPSWVEAQIWWDHFAGSGQNRAEVMQNCFLFIYEGHGQGA